MQVIKRDGSIQPFDIHKLKQSLHTPSMDRTNRYLALHTTTTTINKIVEETVNELRKLPKITSEDIATILLDTAKNAGFDDVVETFNNFREVKYG